MYLSERMFQRFLRQRVLLQLGMYNPGFCVLICTHWPAERYLCAGERGGLQPVNLQWRVLQQRRRLRCRHLERSLRFDGRSLRQLHGSREWSLQRRRVSVVS